MLLSLLNEKITIESKSKCSNFSIFSKYFPTLTKLNKIGLRSNASFLSYFTIFKTWKSILIVISSLKIDFDFYKKISDLDLTFD